MDRGLIDTFPTRDRAFRRTVLRLVEQGEPESARELADRLRPMYPRVAVVERQLSGESRRFYVYRDGRYETAVGEEWWEQPGVPTIRFGVASATVTWVNEAWASLIRGSPDEIVGRNVMDFVRPDARPIADALFEAILQEREVGSQGLLVRLDGTTVLVEFHAAQDGDEVVAQHRPVEEPLQGGR